MALSFVGTLYHVTCTLSDGTGTPLTHTVEADTGELSVSGLVPGLREAIVIERKSVVVGVSYGKRVYPTFQLTLFVDELKKASPAGTAQDFVFATSGSAYSARKSTLTGSGTEGKVPFACDVALAFERSNFNGATDAAWSWEDWLIESCDFQTAEDGNKLVISGKVLGAFTGDIAIAVAT